MHFVSIWADRNLNEAADEFKEERANSIALLVVHSSISMSVDIRLNWSVSNGKAGKRD